MVECLQFGVVRDRERLTDVLQASQGQRGQSGVVLHGEGLERGQLVGSESDGTTTGSTVVGEGEEGSLLEVRGEVDQVGVRLHDQVGADSESVGSVEVHYGGVLEVERLQSGQGREVYGGEVGHEGNSQRSDGLEVGEVDGSAGSQSGTSQSSSTDSEISIVGGGQTEDGVGQDGVIGKDHGKTGRALSGDAQGKGQGGQVEVVGHTQLGGLDVSKGRQGDEGRLRVGNGESKTSLGTWSRVVDADQIGQRDSSTYVSGTDDETGKIDTIAEFGDIGSAVDGRGLIARDLNTIGGYCRVLEKTSEKLKENTPWAARQRAEMTNRANLYIVRWWGRRLVS